MTKRQKTTVRSVLSLACLAIFVTGWWFWPGRMDGPARVDASSLPRSPLSVSVRTLHPIHRLVRKREFTGTIQSARASRLGFERGGRIDQLLVDEGDHVIQGQILGTVDTQAVESHLEVAWARLTQAEAILAELVAGPRMQTIAAARAEVANLLAEVKRLRSNFERSEQLIASSAISQETFDEARYQLQSAIARWDAADKRLEELLAGTREEQLAAQRAEVQALRAEIGRLECDVQDGRMVAPFAGTITERFVDEGTVVSTADPVCHLVEETVLEAWIGLPPDMAQQLTLGENYSATVGRNSITATLVSLRAQLDLTTRTRNAVFRLSDFASGSVVPGEIVRLELDESISESGYLVPTTALVPGPRGLWNVWSVDFDGQSHRVARHDVELLYQMGDGSLVRGTLRPGVQVIVDGVHRVVDGQVVTPTTTGSDSDSVAASDTAFRGATR